MPKKNDRRKAKVFRPKEQFIIRRAEKGDGRGVIDFFNLATERGINKYGGMNRPSDPRERVGLDRRYSLHQRNLFEFVAVDKLNGKIVGHCSFHARADGRTRHLGEVGWGLHPDYLGRGIATELLKAVLKEAVKRGFVRAEASIAVRNKKSLALARRCGFKIEGRGKWGMLLDDGTYVDTIYLAKILK
jgi:RimJ/RimL family protein N-acetyltransferase